MNERKAMEEFQELLRKNLPVVEELCDVLTKHGLNAYDGERLLSWIIGSSVGKRQAALVSHPSLLIMARGWQMAVNFGDDEG